MSVTKATASSILGSAKKNVVLVSSHYCFQLSSWPGSVHSVIPTQRRFITVSSSNCHHPNRRLCVRVEKQFTYPIGFVPGSRGPFASGGAAFRSAGNCSSERRFRAHSPSRAPQKSRGMWVLFGKQNKKSRPKQPIDPQPPEIAVR